jgi:hypothetical protein
LKETSAHRLKIVVLIDSIVDKSESVGGHIVADPEIIGESLQENGNVVANSVRHRHYI